MKNKNADDLAGCVTLLIVGIVSFPLGILIYGWALSVLWGWFVVPVFGLPVLTLLQAYGLALVIGLTTHQFSPWPKDLSYTELASHTLSVAIVPGLLFLLAGWIVRLFM